MSSRPELLKKRSEQGQKHLTFPAKTMPHSILFQFFDYDYNEYINAIKRDENQNVVLNNNFEKVAQLTPQSFAQIRARNSLELPFPRQLTDSQQIRVAQFERDFLYERIAGGLASFDSGTGAGNFLEGIIQGAEGGLASVRSAAAGLVADPFGAAKDLVKAVGDLGTDKAVAMAGYLARNYIGGDLSKTLGVVGQRVVNPQETLGFSGVDLRNFTFSWDLFPSNKADTEKIRQIVRFLKEKSLPTTEGVAGAPELARAFLNYPSIVEVNLLGVQESHFTRFKRCMISNVTVDYGGGGGTVSIIKGGVPAAVTLSISFSEVQIQTAEDYQESPLDDASLGMTDFSGVTNGRGLA